MPLLQSRFCDPALASSSFTYRSTHCICGENAASVVPHARKQNMLSCSLVSQPNLAYAQQKPLMQNHRMQPKPCFCSLAPVQKYRRYDTPTPELATFTKMIQNSSKIYRSPLGSIKPHKQVPIPYLSMSECSNYHD